MSYEKGQYVVYRSTEICTIGENVKRCFDGKNDVEYIILSPTDSRGVYYIPAEKLESCTRPLMSKEQILELIDTMPDISGSWINKDADRKQSFTEAIKSGDYSLILPMLNAIYNERKRRNELGKRLPAADEKAYEAAVLLLHKEASYSLGIPRDKVEEFISDRILHRNDLQ
ncbi:MAG: CarD family transcriptional regulator [Huintestinicola sp.]